MSIFLKKIDDDNNLNRNTSAKEAKKNIAKNELILGIIKSNKYSCASQMFEWCIFAKENLRKRTSSSYVCSARWIKNFWDI